MTLASRQPTLAHSNVDEATAPARDHAVTSQVTGPLHPDSSCEINCISTQQQQSQQQTAHWLALDGVLIRKLPIANCKSHTSIGLAGRLQLTTLIALLGKWQGGTMSSVPSSCLFSLTLGRPLAGHPKVFATPQKITSLGRPFSGSQGLC